MLFRSLILATVVALPFINRAVFVTAQKAVSVASISERVISPSILASGFLAHEQEVMLSSEVIGRVDKLYVEEGDSVTAGQLVLQVEDINFIASLEQAEAAVRVVEA